MKGLHVFETNKIVNGTRFTFRNGYTLSVVWYDDPTKYAEVALINPHDNYAAIVGTMSALAECIGKPDPHDWILKDVTTDDFAELMRYVSLFHGHSGPAKDD